MRYLEIADCDCIFDFMYQISGLNNIDRRLITVNGKSLIEINQQNRMHPR